MNYFHDAGGYGGKGTWGGLLDTDGTYFLDPNDPNYDSSEVGSYFMRLCLTFVEL